MLLHFHFNKLINCRVFLLHFFSPVQSWLCIWEPRSGCICSTCRSPFVSLICGQFGCCAPFVFCCRVFIRETLSGGGAGDVKMEFLCIADGGCSRCVLVQAAAIHFEKIARREIGAFTTPKNKSRSKFMTPPTSGKEPEESYSRVPISYSILDSIGHCFQVNWSPHTLHYFP